MSAKDDYYNAIDRFSQAMKDRMVQKHKQGFRGWDCGAFHNFDVPVRLLTNAAHVVVRGHEVQHKVLVDIANFAMMLWLRLNQRG